MQLINSQLLTFELARINFTKDAPPNITGNFDWTRREGDLLLVFDTFRTGGRPSEGLKIMQGAHVLYDIPLQAMVEQGKDILERLTRAGAEVTAEQLPCSAIAKSPGLALRYALPNGLIRRLQFRFPSAAEYDKAYNHVRQLGLYLSAGRTVPPANSSSAGHPAPSATRGRSWGNQAQRGSIVCPPSRLSELSNRPHTANQLTSSLLQTQLQETAAARPFSAQPRQPSPLRDQVYLSRPDSGASTVSIHDYEDSLSIHRRTPSATRTETPTFFDYPSASDIPPRRELPFQRIGSPPVSCGSDSGRPSSRASNAFMGPPPLPPPSRSGTVRPSSRAKSSHGNDLPPLPTPTIVNNPINSSPMKRLNTTKRAPSRKGSKSSRPMSAMPAAQENQTFGMSSIPERPSTGYAQSSIWRPSSAISETSQNERHPQYALPTPINSDGLERSNFDTDNTDDANDGRCPLSAYAMQSDEGRIAALNERLLLYLEDPNFLVLLSDVETSFARIRPGSV